MSTAKPPPPDDATPPTDGEPLEPEPANDPEDVRNR
jgi:hypothetical protein